ncbi:MAG: hypothetical protein FJ240_01800 [Nitrospira sp.]|nr:hypothetical protein [Nitrospira sp.]
MPSVRISKELTSGFYYLTFTVRNWHYIFDRHNHANPVRRQYVKRPEDWLWSSANPDSGIIIEPMVL